MENRLAKMPSVRYEWLDAVKAIAMLLVIFGHLGLNSVTKYQAYASFIKLPLFFAASGFVFNPKKTDKPLVFVKERIIRIVLPYFYLCTIICVFNFFTKDVTAIEWAKDSVHQVFTGSIYMWFLPVLFLCNLLLLVVFKIFKENDILILISAFASLVLGGILLPEKHILFDINEVLIAYPFCIFGYFFKKYIMDFDKKILVFIASVCLYLYLALPMIYKKLSGSINYINMYENHYSNYFFDLLISFCGVMAVFVFVRYFKIPKAVSWFGQNTMFYYAFHIPMYTVLMLIIDRLMPAAVQSYTQGFYINTMISCIVTVAAILLLVPFCILVNKYLPFIVGNKRRKSRKTPTAD